MKRVLVLAYLFPPIANSGTMRPLKFVKYLAEHGWDPIVITAASFEGEPTDAALLDQVPPGVRIVRVPMFNDRIADGIAGMLGGTRFGKKVGDAVRWRLRDRRRLPDLYAWWQPTAARAARRVFRETGFDAIYATGFPWTTLMVGRQVAIETGRPLVADFRDAWAAETLFQDERPAREVELAFERQVVATAAAVVTTTDGTVRLMANAYPSEEPAKFIAVHNGFDPADFDVPPQPRTRDKLRLVYTGVWKGGHNPGDLYTAIEWVRRSHPELLERVEVVMAGFAPGEAERRGLSPYITERGRVPHREAVALMRSADVLFFPHTDAVGPWVVSGKVYEYLAAGAPILAHTAPETDSARILQRIGGAIVVPREDPGDLYRRLLDLFATGRFEVRQRDPAALRAFERRTLTAKLAGVLNDVSSRVSVRGAREDMPHPAAAMRMRTR
jgi:glycosyltransferase involved in cell wall biosynthesis